MSKMDLLWKRAVFPVLLVLLLCAVGLTNALAQTFTVGNLNYSLNDDGVSVTVTGHVDGTAATGELVIPESVTQWNSSFSVTAIGESAFKNCSQITSVTIGNSITYIGIGAFVYCTSLTTVNLGNSVSEISYSAFSHCSNLLSIIIPESVTMIRPAVFYGSGLNTVYYNAISCSNMNSGGCGYGEGYWLTNCPSLTTIVIGENVNVIPGNFVRDCNITGTLVIPNSVAIIGNSAFYNCSGLSSIVLGNSVTSIGENAFNGCTGFNGSLTIPNSVSSIGANAFSGCTGFSGTLTLGQSVSQIGNSAFFDACAGFTSFNVLAEVPPTLGNNVFISADYGMPVSVPCGSLNAYQNTSGWNLFTNIQEPTPCMWDITATANPAEGGTVSGAGTYAQGATCTLTATALNGYTFVNWTENGQEVSLEASYSFTVTGNRELVAHFNPPTYTITATANPSEGGMIFSNNIDFDFSNGLQGWTSIDADGDGYEWEYSNSSSTPGHNGIGGMAISRSWINNVVLYPDNYLVSPEISDLGVIVTFYACAQDAGYAAEHFGIAVSTNGNTSPDDFVTVSEWTMSAKGIGSFSETSRSGNRAQGSWYEYSVNLGYFAGQSGFIAIRHFNCSDMFWIDIDDITITSINPVFSTSLAQGETCTLTAMSYNGYEFVNWTEDGVEVSTDAEYSFTVTGDRNLVANFEATPFTISATPNFDGWGTVEGTGEYYVGETCTLTATPSEGHHFVRWLENGQEISTDEEISFTVSGPRELVAVFTPLDDDYIHFSDPNVEAICLNRWDTSGDGFLSYDEAAAVWDIGETFRNHDEITSFNELQYFTGLTSIGYYAFMNCTNLTSVVIPEGVTLLDYKAFAYSGITEITIPESLNSTNNVVFEGCEALTVMNYNAINCTRVAEYSYSWLTGCNSLTTLNIGENVQSIPWGAFRGCSNLTGELTIPESVTSIASDAFAGTSFTTINYNATNCTYNNTYYYGPFHDCYTPATLHIGENVQTIPDILFSGHTGLTGELALPNMLTSIGVSAFAGCSGFTGPLVIPSSVVSIGAGAFSGCSGFTGELVVPASIATIEESVFQDCSGFTGSLVIPDYITYVESYAFNGCTGLNGELTIGSSVEFIGENAFDNTGFTTLNFNAVNCQELGYYYHWNNGEDWRPAFHNFPLTTLNFGEGIENIPFRAFRDLTTLTGSLTLPNSLTTIGEQAFYNCYGFEGIVMGNSVETIGAEAFRNCGGLRGELTLPETLQSVGNYAFAGCNEISTVNYNAINCETMGNASQNVFADCLSLAHIRIGADVESIPNYAFKPCFLVTDMTVAAEVPPTIYASTFGTVSRNIPVSVPMGSGEAYRTAQYWEEFFHITEDYSPSPYTYHWNVNVHQFASNMTVTGIIQIEGVEQSVPFLEIGAFCNGECRGRQLLTYYPQVDRYLVFLMLYGEDGDVFTFRLYDHEAGEELTAGCVSVITFEADAIVGSYLDPYVFNFTDMQLTQLSEGWNWWSTYVEQAGIDGLSLLEESLGDNGVAIRSQASGYTDYYQGYGWYGSLTGINNESSYRIVTSAPCVAAMPGSVAIPSQHPITLSQGWTWIGYLPSRAMDINAALEGLEATQGDMLKSQQGYSDYYPGYGWFGSLNTVEPGMGLMYYSASGETVTFTYPDNNRGGELKQNLTAEHNHWKPNTFAYPDNMTVMAVVELDDEEIASDSYELAAFANGECRGSIRLTYAEPINRHVAFLTISGKDAAELSFRLYDTETGMEYYDAEESLDFVTNAIVGTADDLYTIHFRGTTGMDELASKVQVYPNPVNVGERFSIHVADDVKQPVRVEIVNALGVETLRATSMQTPAQLTAPATAGVYTLRIAVEGKGTVVRKLVVK